VNDPASIPRPGPAVAACAALLLSILSGLVTAAPAEEHRTAAILVERENAFAQAAVDHGTRAAFLEFLGDSAVILAPTPVLARASVESGPKPGSPLRWRADLAMISALGDFGWTSGPFTSWATSTNERPEQSGHYFTVWWVEDGGVWRVILDGGVPYPVAEADVPNHLNVTPRLRPVLKRGGTTDCPQEFSDAWHAKGRIKALKSYLAPDARLLYAGIPPRDGAAIRPASDPLANAVLGTMHVARRVGSEAGDVVVAYGDYELPATLEMPARRMIFIQAWDAATSCKLALEAVNSAH
jgi:hypothetical protein